jgi:SAM-dependent methyltransferase
VKYELSRCAVCDGADASEVAGPDDLRIEAEQLWEFHMRRLSPRTPPERLVDRVAFSQAPPWRVVRCDECGLVYRNPAEKRAVLRAVYRDEELTRDAMLALHGAQARSYTTQARRLRRVLGRRGSGLEVGSYVGAFLAAARALGFHFEGLDVNATTSGFTRSLGFAVHDGEIDQFRPRRTYDVVAIWNTFDQLPDPAAAVRAASRLLDAGGVLAIRVPNGECYARWRARRGGAQLLAQNNLLTFPYRFGFTPGSLKRLLRDNGFDVVRVVRDVLVPTADEWTRRWARVEERVIKPLTRLSAPWFEVYARKPGNGNRLPRSLFPVPRLF